MYFGPGSLSKKMRELSGMKNWSPVPSTTIVGIVYVSMKPSTERQTTYNYHNTLYKQSHCLISVHKYGFDYDNVIALYNLNITIVFVIVVIAF